jgi:hypothetical protein
MQRLKTYCELFAPYSIQFDTCGERTNKAEMVEDDILEILNSINPLTVAPREWKAPRICVDAKKLIV